MANKKISELESRASLSLSDLMAVGDPSTGYLYKTTISDLKTLTGAGVVSFNGRFGTVNPAEGDYTLTQLGDVIITSPSNNQVLRYNGSNWVNAAVPESVDTLDSVTTRGNTTANSITVGSVTAAGLSNLLGQIKTFATTGNTYIGASPASATDAGYKLDVNGEVRANLYRGANGSPLITFDAATNRVKVDGQGYGTTIGNSLIVGDYLSVEARAVFNAYLKVKGANSVVSYGISRPDAPALDSSILAGMGVKFNTLWYTGAGLSFYVSEGADISGGFNIAEKLHLSPSGDLKVFNLAGSGSRMVVTDANGVLSTQAIPTSAVSSVFGRTGAVVAASGDYTTTQVTEGTNLYYTDARARAAITLTTTGSSGAATYSGGTLNIPTYTLAGLGGQPALSGTGFVKISGTTISYDNSTYLTTSSAASTYLPLAGGTLTGALNGTSATFSGLFTITSGSGTKAILQTTRSFGVNRNFQIAIDEFQEGEFTITPSTTLGGSGYTTPIFKLAATGAATFSSSVSAGGDLFLRTTGAVVFNSAANFNTQIYHSSGSLVFYTGGNERVTIASTGAATFSSSVTATQFIVGSATTSTDVSIRFKADTGDFSLITDRGSHAFGIYDHQVASYRMYVNSAGRIGVGTTNPGADLHIYRTGSTADTTIGLKVNHECNAVDYVVFFTGNESSSSNRFVMTQGGSIGIGTETPNATLQVRGDNGSSASAVLRIRDTNATARTTRLQFEDYNGTLADGLIDFKIQTAGVASSAIMQLGVNSPAITMTSAGNVGINTTSPLTKLQVDSTTEDGLYLSSFKTNTGNANTGASLFFGFNDGANNRDAANIKGLKENGTSGDFASYMSFATRTNGGSVTERMRISSTGQIGVGVTPNAWGGNSKAIQIGTRMSVYNDGFNNALFANNTYFNGSDNYYISTAAAARFYIETAGTFIWQQAPSGTAGNAISFTQAMTLTNGGELLLGTTSNASGTPRFHIQNKNGIVASIAGFNFSSTGTANNANNNILSSGAYYSGASMIATQSESTSYQQYSGDHIFYTNAGLTAGNAYTGTQVLKITSSGNLELATGSIKTGTPTGGTAQPWRLGEATNTLYTATRTVKVEINGALYYLLAVASSDL